MMIDDYKDKLDQLLGRMTAEQIRQVLRFAQFIYEDQEPEGTRAMEDPAERYQEFAQWCQSTGIDLGTVATWEKDVAGRGGA
jgi:hypothetical protein